MATIQEQQDAIKALMAQYEHNEATSEPILMINILEKQKAMNEGFPKWMYHATLAPVQVINSKQEAAVRGEGYSRAYIPQSFPAFVFRRNMDPKFENADPVIGSPGDFIEMRSVKSQADMDELLKQRSPKTVIGGWCEYEQLPAATEGPSEDPKITIARLQGQLMAAGIEESLDAPVKNKGGRPRKVQEELVEA